MASANSNSSSTTTTSSPQTNSTNTTLELDFPWLQNSAPSNNRDLVDDLLLPQASPVLPASDMTSFWSPVLHRLARSDNATTPVSALHTSSPSSAHQNDGKEDTSSTTSDSSGYASMLSASSSSTGSPVAASAAPPSQGHPPVRPQPAQKPSASYIEMIARALLSVDNRKLILGEIYAYIQDKYPYYRKSEDNWRNAIRHNLCVNDCFIKSGRSTSGRGYYWTIHPACIDMFSRGDFRRMKARRLAQSMYKTMNKAAEAAAASQDVKTQGQAVDLALPSYQHLQQSIPGYNHQLISPYRGAVDSATGSGYYCQGHSYMTSTPVSATPFMSRYSPQMTSPSLGYYSTSYASPCAGYTSPYAANQAYMSSQHYAHSTTQYPASHYQGYGMPTYLN